MNNQQQQDYTWLILYSNPTSSRIPFDIWTLVLKNDVFGPADHKSLRLVTHAFNHIVTPLLFREVCYQITKESLDNVDRIIGSEDLSQHVKTLVVDTAVYEKSITTSKYAQDAARHFVDNIGLSDTQFPAEELELVLKAGAIEDIRYCFPPRMAGLFCVGYTFYHAAAEFQHDYFTNDKFSTHLARTLISLPALRTVRLQRSWQLPRDRVQKVMSISKDLGFKSRVQAGQAPSLALYTNLRLTLLDTKGWVFSGPGRSARSMYPLHVPPRTRVEVEADPFTSIPNGVVRALSASGVQLESLVFGPSSVDDLSVNRPDHVSIRAVTSFQRRLIRRGDNPLVNAFKSLKHLQLSLTTRPYTPLHLGKCKTIHPWLPNALQGMPSLRSLIVNFEADPSPNFPSEPIKQAELFKLMLEATLLDRDYITCHRDHALTLGIDDASNGNIWLPSEEIAGHSTSVDQTGMQLPNSSPHLLRVLMPNPWPNLVRLQLAFISATRHDVASLMLTIASSLRDLTLEDITLRDCPCASQQRSSWRTLDQDIEDSSSRDSWYDVAIMLNKSLNLEHCIIHHSRLAVLGSRVQELLGCSEPEIQEILSQNENILGRYVVEAPRGQSLAFWLLNTRAAGLDMDRERSF